jgi:predicted dehydrogenase
MKRWRVGIVGLSRGQGFVSVLSAHPRVEVSALCDLNEMTLANTGAAFGLPDSQLFTRFEDFLNADTDIVVVATPIGLHAQQSVGAMLAGKHILCEQTAAYTVEDCERIVNTVKQTGRAYMMAENYCYYHFIREWKQLIAQGKLGDIFYAEAEYIHEIVELLINGESGALHWRSERPPIWYCAHCLGPLLMLMDDRIVKATAAHSGFHRFPEHAESPGFADMEVGLFQTQRGSVIKILRSQTALRPHMVYYSLYGTKGCVENSRSGGWTGDRSLLYIDGATPPGSFVTTTASTSDPAAPEEAQHGGHGTSEYFLIRDFLDAVEAGTRPPIDVIRSMDFTVPGIIAHQAALAGGVWLDVPQFEW